MAEAPLHRILVPSFVDGPGSRMAVFLQGCNLACAYCHNPETWAPCAGCGACVPHCPEGALSAPPEAGRPPLHDAARCRHCGECLQHCPGGAAPWVRPVNPTQILEKLKSWMPYLDGVTLSGGECTLHPEFILELALALRPVGLSLLLDSNGQVEPQILERLAEAADGFLLDFKALDAELHRRLTGRDNGRILASLRRLAELDRLVEVRTVLVPGVTAEEGELEAMAAWLAALPGAAPWRLIPFRPQGVRGELGQLPPLAPERYARLCDLAEARLPGRVVRAVQPGI